MGVLTEGRILSWDEIQGVILRQIRHKATEEFLQCLAQDKPDGTHPPTWGDEIEHTLVKFNHDDRTVKLCLCSETLPPRLNATSDGPEWHPEFARYQVESMPVLPYDGTLDGLREVEASMVHRQTQLLDACDEDVFGLNIPVFPRLCCEEFTEPPVVATDDDELFSDLYPTDIIYPNPRYLEATRNQLHRLGRKPEHNVPVYRDVFTDPSLARTGAGVLADSMGACAGFSALQVTIQAKDQTEARFLYDQFAALTPVLMALTAASPMYGGYLTEWDTRHPIQMGTSVDGDYDEISSGKELVRSRYSSVACYCGTEGSPYNDIPMLRCPTVLKRLRSEGVDRALSDHISHILSHDVFIVTDDYNKPSPDPLHNFNSIQGTVWQTVRLKLPQSADNLGWRVEVRSMEVQLSAFENAAFTTFVWLLSRAMLHFKMNFYIPISELDENVELAVRRDAVNSARLYFAAMYQNDNVRGTATVNDIINGNDEMRFPGLVPMIRRYLNEQVLDEHVAAKLDEYLDFISQRASGSMPTFAAHAREFVLSHPEYEHDSQISEAIQYDLFLDAVTRSQRNL